MMANQLYLAKLKSLDWSWYVLITAWAIWPVWPDDGVKSSPNVSENAQKVVTTVFTLVRFYKMVKKTAIFWETFVTILSPRIFKNRPIWLHWIWPTWTWSLHTWHQGRAGPTAQRRASSPTSAGLARTRWATTLSTGRGSTGSDWSRRIILAAEVGNPSRPGSRTACTRSASRSCRQATSSVSDLRKETLLGSTWPSRWTLSTLKSCSAAPQGWSSSTCQTGMDTNVIKLTRWEFQKNWFITILWVWVCIWIVTKEQVNFWIEQFLR